MNMTNKPILDRALCKKIKAMDREMMDNFIQNIYKTAKMTFRLLTLTLISCVKIYPKSKESEKVV